MQWMKRLLFVAVCSCAATESPGPSPHKPVSIATSSTDRQIGTLEPARILPGETAELDKAIASYFEAHPTKRTYLMTDKPLYQPGETIWFRADLRPAKTLVAKEVAGVHALGGGTARTLGALRERIPGASQSTGQGVSVEVGETQAAIDLEMVTEYGVSIAEVAKAVRRNVIQTVEGMTGLQVTEVNVSVNDIHLPSDDDAEDRPEPARVQ